jgi:hypothetical protein
MEKTVPFNRIGDSEVLNDHFLRQAVQGQTGLGTLEFHQVL